MRINQFLAYHLGISRREGDEVVKQGLVEINGELANLFDQAVDGDVVRFFDQNVWQNVGGVSKESILFYKPIFSVCTKKDPQDRKTVYDLLPKKFQSLKTAGRLDYMSEGLIVLSNDGDLIHQLTHPSQETSKVYLVALKEKMPEEALKILQKGIKLDEYQLQPCRITLFGNFADFEYLNLDQQFRTWYSFELFEGRNNQIRQMCEMVGYKVQRLIRVRQGNFKLTKQLYDQKFLKI